MKTVIVLGSTGMLGQAVMRIFSRLSGLRTWGTSRSKTIGNPHIVQFDVAAGIPGLEKVVEHIGGCHYFINCIGVLKKDIDENNSQSSQLATIVNAFFPHELALVAKKIGAQVIHVSTDGVFSGASEKPYLESHTADATDLYGRTKLMGEVVADSFVTLRCSLIGFDPLKHHGLLEWFMAQPEGAVLSGYSDHLWNGVTTLQFAQLCAKLVLGDEMRRLRNESPIHHFAPNDPVSKFELLELFRRTFKKNVSINSSECPSGPARRILASRYKVLDELFGQGHSLNAALDELLGEYPERARS